MSGRRPSYVGGDHRTRAARALGYPARSVFKLEEIDKRFSLLRAGQRVVDLGAAPGSWSLYVAAKIGGTGRLLSVDLQVIEQAFPSNVNVVQGDAFELAAPLHVESGPYDVILSDMAPNTGGDKAQNAARSYALFSSALNVAAVHGKPGASFVGKIFMGADFELARASVLENFKQCKVVKPKGTRDNSVEVFLVGLERRG